MASHFSTISSLRPRATLCGHVLPSTARVTRSRSGASRLSQQQKQQRKHQVSAPPSLCGLCHQRIVLARRLDRNVPLQARAEREYLLARDQHWALRDRAQRETQQAKEERKEKHDAARKAKARRNRARAALSNWETHIESLEEEDQHQHLQHLQQRRHQSPPPSAAGRHDSAVATSPPPPPPPPGPSFVSPSSQSSPLPPSAPRSPSAASSSASSSSSSSSSLARRAAFDPAQQHRAPSSYRSGKLGRGSLSRYSANYRPGRHQPDRFRVEDTSFARWDWDVYEEEMWWRHAEERFGPRRHWSPFLRLELEEKLDKWWEDGSNWLDELDEQDRIRREEEEEEEEEDLFEGCTNWPPR